MARAAIERTRVESYYRIVAPFYDAEMALRDDIRGWRGALASIGARSALDLGCGSGRLARALRSSARVMGVDVLTELLPREHGFPFVQGDMRALPFASTAFDVAIAADDPFAHLLDDRDRVRAVDEAQRVAGRVVIDGLWLTAADDTRARTTGCVRSSVLADGTVRHETWRAIGEGRYQTTYRYLRGETVLAEATTAVRAWTCDDPALRGRSARLFGGLDGRPYDPAARALVISIGGAL
ncbi:MAG: class I SAM-dependent methyltransferase [Candidatus Limnocylindria bacterium]